MNLDEFSFLVNSSLYKTWITSELVYIFKLQENVPDNEQTYLVIQKYLTDYGEYNYEVLRFFSISYKLMVSVDLRDLELTDLVDFLYKKGLCLTQQQ